MDILIEAPNLLRRYKYGDAFRQYVYERRPLVVAALLIFLTVSAATTAGMIVYFGGTSSLAVLACMVLAPFVLTGSLFVQTFVFFSWLERRALDRMSGRRTRPGREQFATVPWTLAALFVVLPFFVLALLSLKLASTLLLIAILTPVAYSYLDE